MVVNPLEGFFINGMRAALIFLSDVELGDDRARSRAYRDAQLDGVFDTLPKERRIRFDAEAARIERTRRSVINDPRNWQMSGLSPE